MSRDPLTEEMEGGFVRDLDGRLIVVGAAGGAIGGGLTNTELRATPVPVSGTVTASGPLTDAQLRAVAVPVSGTVTADTELTTADLDTGAGTDTRAVAGLVLAASGGGLLVGSANPMPVSGPLTDAQLRATAHDVSAVPATGRVRDIVNSADLVPKFAKANIAAAQTDSSVVAAVTGKKLRVQAVVFVAGATATTITFNSASTAISCLFANAANGGAALPFNPCGWFETVAGEALTATTGAGATTGIQVQYVEV